MKTNKLNVMFVGGFELPKDGSVGGQLIASTILVNSAIKDHVVWFKVDSTQKSNPLPSIWYRLLNSLFRLLKFINILLFKKIDVVLIFSASGFSLYEKGFMAYLARIAKVPVVFAPRGSGLLKQFGFKRKINRFFLRKCTYIMCQSSQWQVFYNELTQIPKRRIVIVKNWIQPSLFYEIKPEKPKKELKIVYIGWMVKLKGVFDLLEAVKLGADSFINTEFIMCGGGDDLALFVKTVQKHGLEEKFKILGWVERSKTKEILWNADIFVLPSYGEGMPNSILEAMDAGKAIVATNVGGIPDMITHGVDGLLYEPGDILGLVNNLQMLIHDNELRVIYGQQARIRALNNHDINVVWKQILNLLEVAADIK